MRSVVVGLLLGMAVALAATIGTTAQPWHWGPALLAVAAALAARGLLPTGSERRPQTLSAVVWLPVVLAAGWITYRATNSPVPSLARADLTLLATCGAGFWLAQEISPRPAGIRAFAGVLAAVVVAQFVVTWMQLQNPSFTPIYQHKGVAGPTGFFGHYIFFSHFVAGAALLLGGVACFGRGPLWWRLALGLAAVLGIVCVAVSRARGGTLALAGGLFVFILLSLLVLKQRKHRAFPAVAIGSTVLLLAGIACIPLLIRHVQTARGLEGSTAALLDDDARLRYFELAAECIARHPWLGGGSRSYSWENYAVWRPDEFGWMPHDVVFAHNELLQSATDYGLVGALLVVLAAATIGIYAIVSRIGAADSAEEAAAPTTGVLVGGLAAVFAMLLESMFSFAFHLLPLALLLGICLGLVAGTTRRRRSGNSTSGWATAGGLFGRVGAIAGVVLLGFAGIRATAALRELWPLEAGWPEPVRTDTEMLARANERWPNPELAQRRAALFQTKATADGNVDAELLDEAIAAYLEAAELHPYNPATAVNLANALSLAGRWEESEQWFVRAHDLQGGVIAAFGTRYFYAQHLARRGWIYWEQGRTAESHGYYQAAAAQLRAAGGHIPLVVQHAERVAFRTSVEDAIKYFDSLGVTAAPIADPLGVPEL